MASGVLQVKSGFDLTLKAAKGNFFDRPKVIAAVDKARLKYLRRAGGYVRKIARNSMKASKNGESSQPGEPPRYHTRALKDFIFFSFDPQTKSTVVGPVVLNQLGFTGPAFRKVKRGLAPQTLEYGGLISIFETQLPSGTWVRGDFRSRRRIAERPQRWRTVKIEPRPYMGPAREKAEPKLPGFWKDLVK